MWGAREKSGWGVSWTISKLSASTPTSGRLQARTRGNSAGQRNKGRNILWRHGSLQQKPELDYGMETYARTWREGPRRGWPKASGLVLVRSPLLTRHKWCEFVSFRRLVCRCHVVFIWCYVGFVLFRFHLYTFIEAAALRSVVLRYAGAPTATRVSSSFSFCFFGDIAFPEYFCTIAVFSLYGEYALCFSFWVVLFYLVTTGWIVCISLCGNSTNQSINSIWRYFQHAHFIPIVGVGKRGAC